MAVNKQIVASVAIIGGAGILRAWTATPPQPISRVVLGSYVVLLVLSVVDIFGPPASTIAGGIAMVAVVYTLITVGGAIISAIQSALAGHRVESGT